MSTKRTLLQRSRQGNLSLTLVVILLLLAFNSFSQSKSIFAPSVLSYSGLNVSQKSKYDVIAANPNVTTLKLVTMEDFSTVQRDGKLLLDLGFMPCPNIVFHATWIDYVDDNNFEWSGEIRPADESDSLCGDGFITFVNSAGNGGVLGSIMLNGHEYQIYDLGDGVKVIAILNYERMDEYLCGIPATVATVPGSVPEAPIGGAECTKRDLRILVLYTPQAKAAVNNNMLLDATLSIAKTNTIFSNSQVNSTAILAGVAELPGYVETLDISNETENVASNATAQALRNTYRADLVILMGKKNYITLGAPKVYGYMREIGSFNPTTGLPDAAFGYGVVDVNNNLSRLIFPHEVSHLLGARHNDDTRTSPAYLEPSAKGHTFEKWWLVFITGAYRTTVTNECYGIGCPTIERRRTLIPYLSNPDVSFNTRPTGTSTRNNAKRVKNHIPAVASFYVEAATFTNDFSIVYTLAPDNTPWESICKYSYATLYATASCGRPNYVHTWEESYDGINWSVIGTGPSIVINSTVANVFIRLKTRDLNGSGMTKIKQQTLNFQCTLFAQMQGAKGSAGMKVPSAQYTLSPNPAQGAFAISYVQSEADQVVIRLIDMTGRVVSQLYQGTFGKGSGTVEMGNGLHIAPGTYFVQIKGASTNHTLRLVIN